MNVFQLFFFFQIAFVLIFQCHSRECKGDGHYVDFPRDKDPVINETGQRQFKPCSEISHELQIPDDEDTPDFACKHRYCPSCIQELRRYCVPVGSDNNDTCVTFRSQLKEKKFPNSASRDEVDNEYGVTNVCTSIGAQCDGFCGEMIKKIDDVTKLVDEDQATPYKVCKEFKLC